MKTLCVIVTHGTISASADDYFIELNVCNNFSSGRTQFFHDEAGLPRRGDLYNHDPGQCSNPHFFGFLF